jgi:hypothetical protein
MHEEWIRALEDQCFIDCASEKKPNGLRMYERADCLEYEPHFEEWLDRISLDRLETLLTNLMQK